MAGLDPLLAHLPVWLLVLFRISGIFLIGPFFGSAQIPMRIKIFLALGLSFCVYPMLLGHPSNSVAGLSISSVMLEHVSLWRLAYMVAAELMIGLIIGFGAMLPLVGIQVGGQIIDQQLGLGLAAIYNADTESDTSIISQFYYLLALTLFLILNGHRALLSILIGSFNHVPLGGYVPDGHLVELMVGLLQSMFELAIGVAAPLLCLVFLETVAMGFIARTVPQLNIMSVGFSLRIVVGLFILIAGIGGLTLIYQDTLWLAIRRVSMYLGG
jgi:flagellar biosynthetic protein FliR